LQPVTLLGYNINMHKSLITCQQKKIQKLRS
jgi:hypothetical protein